MTYIHIGNNVFYGTDRDEIPNPSTNSVFTNINTGDISIFGTNAWTTTSYGGKTDQLFSSIIYQIPLSSIGTTYKDVFPAFFDGFPIPIDFNGFKNMGIVILWNKNGGTGIHDMRLVNDADPSQVLVNTESVRIVNDWPHDGLKNGRTKSYNIPVSETFQTFRGELRIQAKSTVGTDNPIFNGLLIYLIR